MIVATLKPIDEILEKASSYRRILVLGCGTCATISDWGGMKAVRQISEMLRMARSDRMQTHDLKEFVVQRQCEPAFLDPLLNEIRSIDAILSLACGVGVQILSERFPDITVLPAADTHFIGTISNSNVYREYCRGCGDCDILQTGGVCLVARCPKASLNGPCGGEDEFGMCEVDPKERCVWIQIAERLTVSRREGFLDKIVTPKDWSRSRSGRTMRIPDDGITDESES
ncbi:methylenetetrahydrofolate reductase C-terminal domain-containing protein [bacterium]|nr:methylenetetrahydrofolate reductase C-terminal domain-containing protein [candidate division CSSED10-310 bacterium]